MGDVTILVPWRVGVGCRDRLNALNWVCKRAVTLTGRLPLMGFDGPDGEWCKAQAIRRGLRSDVCGDIVVICDGDSWSNGVPEAVQAVRDGAPWAVPHYKVHRLTPPATTEVYEGSADLAKLPTEKPPYRGHAGGGILVAPKETLQSIPPDLRFIGWGSEDCAWRDALRTLVGMEWRESKEPLIHLWHPPALNESGERRTSDANADLARRYIAARGDQEAMQELVNGG